MSVRRSTVLNKIKSKTKKISDLENEISLLKIQEVQISDKYQIYVECIEDVITSRRPKVIEKMLIGKILWKEDFLDEDTGQVISIDRSSTVRRDDVWFV